MKKTYYRNEYTPEQWKSVIDRAAHLGCQVTYSQYGTNAVIDSTRIEDRILSQTGKSCDDSAAREFWADHIFAQIDESANFVRWIVYHVGEPNKNVSIFLTERDATLAKENAEYQGGMSYDVRRVNIIPNN